MKEMNKERNYVDVFSDYGLDERQRSISSNIGIRCFRVLYTVTLILTAVWLIIDCVTDMNIPTFVTAVSYFAAAIVCYCIYALRSAKAGVINGITAFFVFNGQPCNGDIRCSYDVCIRIGCGRTARCRR